MSINYSSFEELTRSASKYLEDIGRSKQTVIIYNWIWKKIKLYMEIEQIDKCSSNTINDYLSLTYGEKPISRLTHHQKHCLRCALCLAQFAQTGKMIEIIQRREAIKFEGEIGLLMKQYIDYKGSMRLNQKTLQGHSWYLYQSWKYLNTSGISSSSLLSPLIIMKYSANLLPQAAGAKHLALSETVAGEIPI